MSVDDQHAGDTVLVRAAQMVVPPTRRVGHKMMSMVCVHGSHRANEWRMTVGYTVSI